MPSVYDIENEEHDPASHSKQVKTLPIDGSSSVSGTIAPTTTAAAIQVSGSPLAGRRGVFFQNESTVVLLWGFSANKCVHSLSACTASADGKGGSQWIDVTENATLYVKTAGDTGSLSVSEIK